MLSLSDCFRTPIPTRACPSFVVETLLKHYFCVLVFMRPSHLFPPPIMFFFVSSIFISARLPALRSVERFGWDEANRRVELSDPLRPHNFVRHLQSEPLANLDFHCNHSLYLGQLGFGLVPLHRHAHQLVAIVVHHLGNKGHVRCQDQVTFG